MGACCLGPQCRLLTWDEWRQTGQDAHSANVDPMFANPAKHDYRLKPTSPALRLGIEQIDLTTVGPRKR